ncbi:protein phosphatase 2C [Histomonas meleagridis]|uniref:protein phosphatase 2C n=1 Tax=Histomonas meleagridis TaxID=135588 RepID=UPI00355AC4FE|nr:protein phosphatase 2C [Histomonas meleagridis]KAH0801538.1 protein phosphatase 2C [Histomonas meleagridis]
MVISARRKVQEKHFFLQGKQIFPGGHAEATGKRPTMEDAATIIGEFSGPNTQFYGVFDGHGSAEPSRFAAQKLPSLISDKLSKNIDIKESIVSSIKELNETAVEKWRTSGTTVAIVIIMNNKLYTANVGDTRIILVQNGIAKRLSQDHKISDPNEQKSVCDRGGVIFQDRVNGILALSRAVGDGNIADCISCEPFINESDFDDNCSLIIACDGVWDVMEDQEAAEILCSASDAAAAARAIKEKAIQKGTQDNVTVICVTLKPKE